MLSVLIELSVRFVYSALVPDMIINTKFSGSMILKNKAFQYHDVNVDIEQNKLNECATLKAY